MSSFTQAQKSHFYSEFEVIWGCFFLCAATPRFIFPSSRRYRSISPPPGFLSSLIFTSWCAPSQQASGSASETSVMSVCSVRPFSFRSRAECLCVWCESLCRPPVVLYAVSAVYFAGVMVRLMLTLTPVVCVLSAVAFSSVFERYLSDDPPAEDDRRNSGSLYEKVHTTINLQGSRNSDDSETL